jgi:hypothetical protein
MASPPRRMTRARAKKEGYEPDWRINPHWKTPKKPKVNAARIASEDKINLDNHISHSSSVTGSAARQLSPVKIRITPKLPPQLQMDNSSTSTTTTSEPKLPAIEPIRKLANLGSPVRVRPRTEINFNTAADKENSPSAAMLATWTTSGKSAFPTTTTTPSHTRPLEASPSSINTHRQTTTIKVLSTPVRILNPQTPGRNLGSARRIPIKVEKTKSATYKLDPISDVSCPESHRDFSYRVNRCQGATKLASNGKGLISPVRSQQPNTQVTQSNPGKSLDLSRNSNTNAIQLTAGDNPSETKTWVPLKAVPTLQRPKTEFSDAPTRPVKSSISNSTSRSVTKRDFYVDETLSVPPPTEPKSRQRASAPVPKFPIRRRSISQSSSPTEKVTPKSRILSNPIHFNSLEELKPKPKFEKWKTPIKRPVHTPSQAVRKVCFRTPSMETPGQEKGIQSLRESSSILSLATPNRLDSPNMSTTPIDMSQSPSSPKVFDLSDSDSASFELFTPRQPKITTIHQIPSSVDPGLNLPTREKPGDVQPVGLETQFNIFTPKPSSKNPRVESSKFQDDIPIHKNLQIPKGPARNVVPQRDFSVPIKEPHVETPVVTPKPPSASPSAKSSRGDKGVKGPLYGVIAFVDVKTADGDDASAPFAESLKNLGARVVKQWTWNGEELEKVGITHVIFKQGGPRTLSKVKLAKGSVKCVGLGWISQ